MLSKTHAAAADARAPLMTAFLAALPDHPATPPPEADRFVAAFAADYRGDELPGVSLADLAGQAASLWAFAANGDSTCALLSNFTVACWGANTGGQLGLGGSDGSAHPTPTVVANVAGATAIAVVMLTASFVILLGINVLQRWSSRRLAA